MKPAEIKKRIPKEMCNDIKEIYVVTTMNIGPRYINARRSRDGKYHSTNIRIYPSQKEYFGIRDQRTWGWFSKLEDAQKAVANNWADMYERSYPVALIERVAEGLLSVETREEWWYKWSSKAKGYKPWRKPKEFKSVMGFGL